MPHRLIYPERAMQRMPVPKSTRQTKSFCTPAICTALLWMMSAWACSNDAPVSVLRLGHGLDTRHPVHRALVEMAEGLEARSGGTLQMVIYPAEQLGNERESLELLQLGSLDLTKVSAAVLEGFVPAFVVTGVPYLFRDEAHRHAFFDHPVGEKLLREADPLRLHGLVYFDAGARSFYTRERLIPHPDGLANLRIRTQESPAAIALVRSLGAAATPIAWGELYTALQQGVVDGAENNPPSYLSSRHYETAPYFVLDEHTAVPDVLLVSGETWNQLTEQQQSWLKESARAAASLQRKLWRKASEAAMTALRNEGVEILVPDRGPFVDRLAVLRESYRQRPELRGWIDDISGVKP